VLSQSRRLSDADLCDIARVRGNAHLLAISTRQHLAEAVTDILINRGDNLVARTVAGNETARLSERGLTQLIERAESDETIGAGVYARADVPADLIKAALAKAVARSGERGDRIAAAQRLALSLKHSGDLTEEQVVAFASVQKYEETIAALSLMVNLKFSYIENMLHGSRLGGLTLVCKSLGFSMQTMSALWDLAMTRNRVSREDVHAARKEFLSISRDVAQRVLRFWQVRQSAGGV